MSNDRLLLIISRWKNEAFELSRQLEYIKNDYQEEYIHFQQKLNQIQIENNLFKNSFCSSLTIHENILEQLLKNVDQSSISDQLSVLCDFFVNSLKTLLLSKVIEEKVKLSPIIETIETNIGQIGDLINKMNKQCYKQLIIKEK